MKLPRMRAMVVIGFLFLILGEVPTTVQAEESNDRALPKAWEKIKEVGREARHEFSQATRKTAGAIKKAVKGEKSAAQKAAK